MPSRTLATRRVAVLCTTALLLAGLTACGSATPTSSPASPGRTSSSTTASALVLDDGWVKAADVAPSGQPSTDPTPSTTMPDPAHAGAMTGLFGTLRNTSDRDVTVTAGASPVAEVVELHETVRTSGGAMQMQPVVGGFTVPAGGTRTLEPGADHVMLMGLTRSLPSGTTVTVTLTTSAGEVHLTVPVRAFPGAAESYVPTPSPS